MVLNSLRCQIWCLKNFKAKLTGRLLKGGKGRQKEARRQGCKEGKEERGQKGKVANGKGVSLNKARYVQVVNIRQKIKKVMGDGLDPCDFIN